MLEFKKLDRRQGGEAFRQSIRSVRGDVVYLSGCLGNVPGTQTLVPGGLEGEVGR